MGDTPMAFSMSAAQSCQSTGGLDVCERAAAPTSKAVQPEGIQLANLVGELAVVLDDVDVVRRRQQAGERRGLRIP